MLKNKRITELSGKMKTEKIKTNENYNATVVTLDKFVDLEGCDNVKGAIIFGYQVIVSKDTAIGDVGMFFPVECALSEEFLSNNNLFREATKNKDETKKGFFEVNGRVKCMKFRGYKSEGFFIPMKSIVYTGAELYNGDVFNELVVNKTTYKICTKYYVPQKQQPQSSGGKNKKKNKLKKISRMVEDQFRFHIDTLQIRKNAHMLKPDDIISISSKWHGTSWVVGNILTKKKLSVVEKILVKLGVKIKDTEYDYVFSSRSVIKNENFDIGKKDGFYSVDIWGDISKNIQALGIPKGFTLYGEAVGYLPKTSSFIQKDYDYGCPPETYKMIVYKITYTNEDGKVFLVPYPQMVEFCKSKGLETPPLYYYGKVKDLFPEIVYEDKWHGEWVEKLFMKSEWGMNDVDCLYSKNKVPSEGVVIRREDSMDFDTTTLKAKNFRFLEKETKDLDKGVADIESTEA